jgi:hypothetical protein
MEIKGIKEGILLTFQDQNWQEAYRSNATEKFVPPTLLTL